MATLTRIFSRKTMIAFALLALWLLGNIGCDSGADFSKQRNVQIFVQNYLPQYLDILWMIEDRSPMSNAQTHLVNEAREFFTKLDGVSLDYQMGFVSADMELHPGLKPTGNPVILVKNKGTVSQRVTAFSNMISQIINLKTGGTNQGFESVLSVLKSNGAFKVRAGVPLIILFISDSDDSRGLSTKKPISYYRDQLLALKGNNPDLLRVYAVNYVAGGDRCATYYNADIDRSDFEDRYFQLTQQLNGDTGDLCGNFSDQLDLSGLRLEELPTRFKLRDGASSTDMEVKLFFGGVEVSGPSYTIDDTTDELVFSTAPVEGTTIVVTYFSSN